MFAMGARGSSHRRRKSNKYSQGYSAPITHKKKKFVHIDNPSEPVDVEELKRNYLSQAQQNPWFEQDFYSRKAKELQLNDQGHSHQKKPRRKAGCTIL